MEANQRVYRVTWRDNVPHIESGKVFAKACEKRSLRRVSLSDGSSVSIAGFSETIAEAIEAEMDTFAVDFWQAKRRNKKVTVWGLLRLLNALNRLHCKLKKHHLI